MMHFSNKDIDKRFIHDATKILRILSQSYRKNEANNAPVSVNSHGMGGSD